MKWTGLSAIACAVATTVACSGDGRRGENDGGVRSAGESGTVGTSGQAEGVHGATADARYFAEKAAFAGNAEVTLGRLAIDHAESAPVKEFAEMMVRDHSKAGSELRQSLRRHSIDVPEALDDEHQRLYDRLSTLQGGEFDREYMKAMVEGHREVKSMIASRTYDQVPVDGTRGTIGTSGAAVTQLDAAVNAWARRALPTVEHHLQKAQQVRAGVGTSH